jgi:3-dehydroquinate synthase
VRDATGALRAALVTDARVARLHSRAALTALRRAGLDVHMIVVPAGERSKSLVRLNQTWSFLARSGIGRADAVIALGGGVVGDLAGFAAATWWRGVPWINVPTTVIAQADSAIGGKTAIDLDWGKNLVGAYHQPAAVLVDPDLLGTLSEREYRAGMAEVIKTGFVADRELFGRLECETEALSRRHRPTLGRILSQTLAAKGRIVAGDEREREGGRRTALNFGHTLGHALEAALGYRTLKHGQAIAIGMRFAAWLSVGEAGLAPGSAQRLETLLDRWRMPRRVPAGVDTTRLRRYLSQDKKGRHGVRWVLTPRVGHASVPRLISDRRIRAALKRFGARHG